MIQPGGVARDDRVRRDRRGDALVQVELPVHPLGDRLDDRVAVLQLVEVLLVVGLADQCRILRYPERRRLQLLQALDRLRDNAVLRPFLGRQVEQHDRHLDVDEVGGDLRPHHAGAQHRDLAYIESIHRFSSKRLVRRTPGFRHLLGAKSTKQKRRASRDKLVAEGHAKPLKRALPFGL